MHLYKWMAFAAWLGVACAEYWSPSPYCCWNIQLISNANLDPNTALSVDFLDVDMEDITADIITKIHALNKKVVCYINVGAYENWRSDKGKFPPEIIGQAYDGWAGEQWLDVSPAGVEKVKPIMLERFKRAKAKGCDGIDPDNSHLFQEQTGFPITYADAKAYNIWIANTVHGLGMSVGLKNNFDQWPDLIPYYDFAVNENAIHDLMIDDYVAWRNAGKPVFGIEYEASQSQCAQPESEGFSWVLKQLNLGTDTTRCGCTMGGVTVSSYTNGQVTNPVTIQPSGYPATAAPTKATAQPSATKVTPQPTAQPSGTKATAATIPAATYPQVTVPPVTTLPVATVPPAATQLPSGTTNTKKPRSTTLLAGYPTVTAQPLEPTTTTPVVVPTTTSLAQPETTPPVVVPTTQPTTTTPGGYVTQEPLPQATTTAPRCKRWYCHYFKKQRGGRRR